MPTFYEFFAGGGMARSGLGAEWKCLFSNDIDEKKAASYISNWGKDHLAIEDIAKISSTVLPDIADLVWASFPCQDLSLAGAGAGLNGKRSGTFWPFWEIIKSLCSEGRAPKLIALENVCGALTSHGGKDFAAICEALSAQGYRFGAVVIDAACFVPQSRPRLFIIGVHSSTEIPDNLVRADPQPPFHTSNLIEATKRLNRAATASPVWWDLPLIPKRNSILSELIEDEPVGVKWHSQEETKRLLDMMSQVNAEKVLKAQSLKKRVVGSIYKRTRIDEYKKRVQRAEVRFDDIAGCLRTPTGGSSRQIIIIVNGNTIRTRLLAPREAARLMGLSEDYKLPPKYNDAYHLIGDGVAVPVVRYLAKSVFEPILKSNTRRRQKAA
nr:DNA cytosine methyltransferase [uncultured Cohaesibacter sp.]